MPGLILPSPKSHEIIIFFFLLQKQQQQLRGFK